MVQTEMFAAIAAIRPQALDSFASTRPALFRLRAASPIRATSSLSIGAGVAKFSRANPA